MNTLTMIMIAFMATLALATVISNFIWGERGMFICIGIIVIVLGLLVAAIGCTLVYNYIFNYPII